MTIEASKIATEEVLPKYTKNEHNTPKHDKLEGYEFYRSIGSPKYVVAPMVDQSELAWRLLSKSPLPPSMAGPSETIITPTGKKITRHAGGTHVSYTPMIHAKVFMEAKGAETGKRGDGQFNLTYDEEGGEGIVAGIEGGDRPVFAQFCANDPEILLAAAQKLEHRVDAVDINFGCPQGIAKRGHYGSFLQDEWDLVYKLINTLHVNLKVPVTAKFRIFPSLTKTLAYAKMMEEAGAQILTCHGRTREMKGQFTGLADWEMIKKVKEHVNVPVFANGNILYYEDVERCLEQTGCDGVMTAEGNLSNPAIFLPPSHPHFHPPITVLANRYIDIVSSLKSHTAGSAIKAHMFRMLKPILDTNEELRIKIAQCPYSEEMTEFKELIKGIEQRLEPIVKEAGPSFKPPPIDPKTGYRSLPIFCAQPQIRAKPISTEIGGTEEFVNNDENLKPSTQSGTCLFDRSLRHEKINNKNKVEKCINEECGGVAAIRCPTKACIIHCRINKAIESGLTEEEAKIEFEKNGLIGLGCESHEEKEKLRKERLDRKRKNKAEFRAKNKHRKKNENQIIKARSRSLSLSENENEN
ncbi:uncharacterized protein I206_101114 [Kwoniella pini CBS 10737]|uniref:tRNA-dihydrouridine(16/17) synthase [NAD(P)(+)] n=1 Tax=Kwoniella pini CBS 10737 TaxID=1296096 RepID=A0A1B9IBW3_9TREE|nr:tRNA-dihydrouridine synthase 1 [Kwoniella pini CBS 10737]OCF52911.1 tRNA-dihydrouridine synthase 1 [Kwoniella pini CBS 10737]